MMEYMAAKRKRNNNIDFNQPSRKRQKLQLSTLNESISHNNNNNSELYPRSKRLMANSTKGKLFEGKYRIGEYYIYTNTHKTHQHHISPKHKSMKEELTKNTIYSIPLRTFNETKEYAENFLNIMIKQCEQHVWTNDECFTNFGIRLYARDHVYYNERYNIKSGQQICVFHLVAVMLFFNNTRFCAEIRKTYWNKQQHETLEDMKEKHSNFAHTCRRLCEAIYLYGNKLPTNMRLYRGVTQRKFECFNAVFSGAVSTTDDFTVARGFAGTGCVMELQPSENDNMYIKGGVEFSVDQDENFNHVSSVESVRDRCEKSFDLCNDSNTVRKPIYSLSNFSNEKEYLLWSPCMDIINLYTRYPSINYKPYVSAMRLFEKKIISGHLMNEKQKKQLLFDDNHDIQHALYVLIQWKMYGDQETKACNNMTNGTLGGLDMTNKYIVDLCDTWFQTLSKKIKLFPDIEKLNANLHQTIETLLTEMKRKGCQILQSIKVQLKISWGDLEYGMRLNDIYLPVNEYLKRINSTFSNEILNCDIIMHCIGEYFERRYAIACLECGDGEQCDWKCEMKYENELYEINPVILLIPTTCRTNNEYYNFVIQIPNMEDKKGTNSIKWSFDILCEELDICLHFGETNIANYRQRQYTQIISNHMIRELVDNKKDIVWNVNFRFYQED